METAADNTIQDLAENGYMLVKNPFSSDMLQRILLAAQRLKEKYPYGFDHSKGFNSDSAISRKEAPKPTDRAPTIIYHNAGFYEPDLLLPLRLPEIHDIVEKVVGVDYYLSNVWLQIVPPNTGRMAYHKDEHGSISITVPLDEIVWNSGSTCVIPRSHRNTPPPHYCIKDISSQHPDEVHLMGDIGDAMFFSAETWHGRAANLTANSTCRLFFNFYSQASRDRTRWSDAISKERVSEVAKTVPEQYRHMFRIDAQIISDSSSAQKTFKNWVMNDGSSSFSLMREFFYWRIRNREKPILDGRGKMLAPFRTSITEGLPFKSVDYLKYLDLKVTAKNFARELLGSFQQAGVTAGQMGKKPHD